MNKVQIKSRPKNERIEEAGYKLFIKKGIGKTTIQNIVDAAEVAKGTFYLYYTSKEDLIEKIIINKTSILLWESIETVRFVSRGEFAEDVLSIVDIIIDKLKNDKEFLAFIYKDLTQGFYNSGRTGRFTEVALELIAMFENRAKKSNIKMSNPTVTIFMIFELVGSTCYSCILHKFPMDIDSYKPYLYEVIRKILG